MFNTFENGQWYDNTFEKRVIHLKVHKAEETSCALCLHQKVCGHDMSKRCENYTWGTSEGKMESCQACSNKYNRYDKTPIACFQCPDFLANPRPRFRVFLDDTIDNPGEAYAFDGERVHVHLLHEKTFEPLNAVFEIKPEDLFVGIESKPFPAHYIAALPHPRDL